MPTLRDLGSEPFESVPAGSRPADMVSDQWTVLIGAAGPLTAVPPGVTLAGSEPPPGVLVAAADMDLADALESDAFAQFTDVTALILTEPDADLPGEQRVAGVVDGRTLARLMFRGPTRGVFGVSGPVLPGPPAIPLIARSCGYLEGGAACATPMSFAARPSPLPDCPNQRGLTAHPFAW